MAKDILPKFRLYQDTYNDAGYSSVTHLSNALQTKSEMLSPIVTHLYGSDAQFGSKNFPLSFITEGMKNIKSINSIDYHYPVIGRPKKTSTIGKTTYVAGEKPGLGNTKFAIYFKDRWFSKGMVIISPSRHQVRIQEDPTFDDASGMYKYMVQNMNPAKTLYCPIADLKAGVTWGRIIVKVGIEDSRGTESRSYSPGQATNQLSIVRDSYRYKGNVQNKIMVIEINAGGKKTKYWSEWEMYLRNLEWKEKCETDLWYSEYNKNENGEIVLIDEDSGAVIPSGAGLLQQIPNEEHYSQMTTKKLESIITDVFFNASDSTAVNVEIFTGTGGLREADRAMKQASSGFTLVDTKQISGSGNEMVFGAYFKVFKHIDGHTVTFRHLPLLDGGTMADISAKHPIDGLPMESYNMYIVDNSTYDGERNIQYVSEKGRENIEFYVSGATVPMGYPSTMNRASDRDSASIHWMKSQGICVKKPTNCVKVFCTMS